MNLARAHARLKKALSTIPRLRILVAVAVLALLPLGSAAAVPVIEGFPHYQPQSKCSPKPKPGTVALEKWLLKHYPGSGSLGISRACDSGGLSEHKEGRAFDWALDASSARDRGYAQRFIDKVRATDRFGHRAALARRMGIMYLIWNDHIYSASYHYAKRPYLNSGCRSLKKCSVSLRHRNHMHISLTRKAARGETSWYRHHGVTPATPQHHKTRHHKTRHHKTRHHKTRHHHAATTPDRKRHHRHHRRHRDHRPTSQQVQQWWEQHGHDWDPQLWDQWQQQWDGNGDQDWSTHDWSTHDWSTHDWGSHDWTDHTGSQQDGGSWSDDPSILNLRRQPLARVTVPTDGSVVTTDFKVREGVGYKLTAAGLFGFGHPDQVADAVCAWSPRAQDWQPSLGRHAVRRHGSLDLVVDGRSVFAPTCRSDRHVYTARFTPQKTKPLRLRVVNRGAGSTGSLVLLVSRPRTKVADALPTYPSLREAPTPAASLARTQRDGFGLVTETVGLPAQGAGVTTAGGLEPGATYRVAVSGVVRLGHKVRSDGQCVRVRGTWYDKASIDPRTPGADHGNLYVNGLPFEGTAVGGAAPCASHVHVGEYTADGDGTLALGLWDPLDPADDSGSLTVRVQRLTAIPEPAAASTERPRRRATEWRQDHDWFEVAADDEDGTVSTMRVRTGERVQVQVRGVQHSNGYDADASCLRTPAGWVPRDPAYDLAQDPLNLWVDGQPVTWRSLGRSEGCSDDYHGYIASFTASKNGPLRVGVFDLDYRDNKGSFDVTLLRG
jgi:hypothetical protein